MPHENNETWKDITPLVFVSKYFESQAKSVENFQSYSITLMSGILIGILTNYIVQISFTPSFTSSHWIAFTFALVLLGLLFYLFMYYSCTPRVTFMDFQIPEPVNTFIREHPDKFVEWLANDAIRTTLCKKMKVIPYYFTRETLHISIMFQYTFLRIFCCKISLSLNFSAPLIVKLLIWTNRYALLHPHTSDQIVQIGRSIQSNLYDLYTALHKS